ncbi:MraY family glycosyltransferase [Legionella hackeliae]|uniref:Glycosyl transferase, group 4 family protein n=1 Tax=Legionella hackeliae TaxID=449 RepID=A0A0A8UNC6_LEGHA|nr:glycosyltransferase family 4 protein [Legionella hackeliae]CEK10243.1 Glycosyl transferase, group 4 family protein [Legionella hackeliae]STX46972.1 alpha-N-acetylglucosaminyltransferase [Legionella hackeliae]
MVWLCFLIAIFSVGYSLTGLLRRYALATSLLDIPNHRSSHALPTPRGGGLSFVFCFIAGLSFLFYIQSITIELFAALMGAGFFVAFIGFMDDHKSVAAKWRLLGHFLASMFALYMLGGMSQFTIYHWTLPSGSLLNVLAVIYLVWLLNLYNFMDGIDGIAAIEAISVCLGSALLYYLHGNTGAMFAPLVLAVAVGGFLCWNFPPARIFMGDAGSGFLGITLGVLSIEGGKIDSNFFWSWLILLGVFIVDATITLFRRALNKEVLLQAHRSHAYQNISRRYNSHLPVTVGTLLINVLWLLPIAVTVSFGIVSGILGLVLAYVPLAILAIRFNAGKES